MIPKNNGYRGNPNIKRGGQQIKLTAEQLVEYWKCSEDCIYFIEKYMRIIHVDRGLIPFELYDYQKERMLPAVIDNRFVIMATSRQVGKSVLVCGWILWYIIFHSEKTVGLLANKGETAREILGRVQLAYQHLPKWLQQGIADGGWNKGSIWLENDSRVIAGSTSSDSIRGYSFSAIILDECAFIDNFDEFFNSTFPTISSGSTTKIIMISCVTKDTMVLGPNGPTEISTYLKTDENGAYEVPPYSVYGLNKWNHGKYMVNSGKAETRIIQSTSSELECSMNHKLWVFKDGEYQWVKSKDLEVGDYVSICYGTRVWGNKNHLDFSYTPNSRRETNLFVAPEHMTDELAYFLGLFVAEGYCRKLYTRGKFVGGQVVITCGDDISDKLNALGLTWCKFDEFHYVINSLSLLKFIEYLGFDVNLKAKNKIIPPSILSLSERNICSFLRGYFDGDGCIEETRSRISVCSASKTLIRQVRMLLLNLGILTSYQTGITPKTQKVRVESEFHRLSMNEQNSMKFIKCIGFGLDRKTAREIGYSCPNRKDEKDIIPGGKSLLEKYNVKFPKNGMAKNKQNLSRAFCLEYATDDLKEIIHSNIKWEKITSIKKSKNEVFDFSLTHHDSEFDHSVIYNGIVGHQTPNGMNHFHKLWTEAEKGENAYFPVKVMWNEVPGRDEAWRTNMIKAMNNDAERFAQEFEVEFHGSSGTLIAGWKLKELTHQIPIKFAGGMTQYQQAIREHKYIVIADTSRGKGLDYSAFQILDVTKMPYVQVCTFRDNTVSPIDYAEIIHRFARMYNNAIVLVENNDIGGQVADLIYNDYEYENILQTENGGREGKRISFGFGSKSEVGLRTTKQVKSVGCSVLKMLIEQNQLIMNDHQTIEELTTFSKHKNSYEAETGKHDDLVMCLVLFGWLTTQTFFQEYSDINTLVRLRERSLEDMMADIMPFGIVDDGQDSFQRAVTQINFVAPYDHYSIGNHGVPTLDDEDLIGF